MRLGTASRLGFWVFAAVVLAFIYVPLGVVTINSFNSDRTFGWPPPGLTTQWWSDRAAGSWAARRPADVREGGARRDRASRWSSARCWPWP